MKVTTTQQAASAPSIFVYGPSGFGKTSAIGSFGEGHGVTIIAAEDGLLPLRHMTAATVLTIETAADLKAAYDHLLQNSQDWVCVDSLTELADVVLAHELTQTDHGMKAYGEMATKVIGFVRALKRLGCGLYVTSHQSEVRDEGTGRMKFGPGLPGQKLARTIPHLFDCVFTIRIGEDKDGKEVRRFQTRSDERYACKDRSGKLEPLEAIDLGAIEHKMMGGE